MSTLINLPPPPSEPITPSEPGLSTPNSTTTSLSALSTTAIKDGHTGTAPPHPTDRTTDNPATNAPVLAAQRADRISRLAGLDRLTADRGTPGSSISMAVNTDSTVGHAAGSNGGDYFEGSAMGGGLAPTAKERSTVGSASATGSTGNKTTWASGSMTGEQEDAMDVDAPSERGGIGQSEGGDPMDDRSSVAGMSEDGNASLVGFGEGAGSTTSGFVSNIPGRSGTITPGQRQQIRSIDATSNSASMAMQARQKAQLASETKGDGTKALGKFDFEE